MTTQQKYEDNVKKILNTTWLIDISLEPTQMRTELAGHFPENSKIVVARAERSQIAHSGLDAESASWIAAGL